jgi:hypothetical protein
MKVISNAVQGKVKVKGEGQKKYRIIGAPQASLRPFTFTVVSPVDLPWRLGNNAGQEEGRVRVSVGVRKK